MPWPTGLARMPEPSAAPWCGGWHREARRVESPNHGPRPAGTVIDLAIVHSISLPPGQYGGDAIEALFTNRLDPQAHPYFETVASMEVSAHFVIRRDGALDQYVDVERRAWHAGRSAWQGRENCNDYAVGIELEGLEGDGFEAAQYGRLASLLADLGAAWPVRTVVGHEHVAPGRKGDPGVGFDWCRLAQDLMARHAQAGVSSQVLAGVPDAPLGTPEGLPVSDD